MTMRRDDLSRDYLIDMDAAGHVEIRARGLRGRGGWLPFFSTDTLGEAQELLTRFCRRPRPGGGLFYRLNSPPADYDALDPIRDEWRAEYETRVAQRKSRVR